MAEPFDFLLDLLRQPTAPFREYHPRYFALQFLQKHKVPCCLDGVGNVIVGAGSPKEYRARIAKGTEPLWILMAHMDHPGFHGVRWEQQTLVAKWHGGIPAKPEGAKCFAMAQDAVLKLELVQLENKKGEHWIRLASASPKSAVPAGQLFGAFDFEEWAWEEDGRIWTKAADDLVGVGAILAFFRRHKKKAKNVVGLLTRAEEVGFIGAMGHLEKGYLRKPGRPIHFLSLETSRQLPGAEVGKGPIVRLGDRKNTFDPMLVSKLTRAAVEVIPKHHQRRVMDGGTCEASATLCYGFASAGISVPLGNYHNQPLDTTGVPAAPEFVDRADVESMVELLSHVLVTHKHPKGWAIQKEELLVNFERYEPLLESLA